MKPRPAQSVQPLQNRIEERRAVKFSEAVNRDAVNELRRKNFEADKLWLFKRESKRECLHKYGQASVKAIVHLNRIYYAKIRFRRSVANYSIRVCVTVLKKVLRRSKRVLHRLWQRINKLNII